MLLKRIILWIIQFVYKQIFRCYVRYQVCSYLVVGVLNTGWNILMFYILYYFVFTPLLGGVMMSDGYMRYVQPHSLALIGSFILTAPIGFYLMRYFTFKNARSSVGQQFIKYIYVLLQGLALEYIVVRVLVEWVHFEATLSKLSASAVVAVLNFFLQRHFTFTRK